MTSQNAEEEIQAELFDPNSSVDSVDEGTECEVDDDDSESTDGGTDYFQSDTEDTDDEDDGDGGNQTSTMDPELMDFITQYKAMYKEEEGAGEEDEDGMETETVEDDEISGKDYSYFDDQEERLAEQDDFEAAGMYIRCIANEQKCTIDRLSKLLKMFAKQGISLMQKKKEMKEAMEMEQADSSTTSETQALMEENKNLKMELAKTQQDCQRLCGKVRKFLGSKEELANTLTVKHIGITLTLRDNKVVEQKSFDADALITESQQLTRRVNALMSQVGQSKQQLFFLEEKKAYLEAENAKLEEEIKQMREEFSRGHPEMESARAIIADQTRNNNQLMERNLQLREQLRWVGACARSAVGIGEQSLMQSARGIPGLNNQFLEPIELTVIHVEPSSSTH